MSEQRASRRNFMRWGSGAAGFALVPGRAGAALPVREHAAGIINVQDFGALGDGLTIDSPGINRAIQAAAVRGGGTVYVPAGTYACFSIHLASNIMLYLDAGAILLAAEGKPGGTATGYDPPEPDTAWAAYQDFGHNHWHNSLIWGEDLHDVGITGQGLIWGKGLERGFGGKPMPAGVGNKSVALKNCRNVTLRDFSILKGGHFAILATGVDNLTLDNLKIDTDRDGIDIDCCKNVRVSNCTVNSPWDDGICPKSSFALGYPRMTENVTITNCYVTGIYQIGSVIDGTFKKFAPEEKIPRIGRIKLGTESNGGFRNITIANCVFEACRGIALESVDGAVLEDIAITNITMRECSNSPLFLRLGSRMRGPKNTPVGTLRRVSVSNVISQDNSSLMPIMISGIPGALIEDVKISDVYLHQVGGGTADLAASTPPELVDEYPDPNMFGATPAYGMFLRHARNVELSNVEFALANMDQRPAVWAEDVHALDLFRLKAPVGPNKPSVALRDVTDFRLFGSRRIADKVIDATKADSF